MRKLLHHGKILDLVLLDGRWEVVEHAPAVVVLVRRGVEVLGVEQRRHAVDAVTWELPAGIIDPGETPEDAARRELAEEAGLGGRMELLARMYSSPGFTDEEVFLFEAHEVVPEHGEADEDEELTLRWRDARQAWDDAREGRLRTSAPSLLGLSLALSRPAQP